MLGGSLFQKEKSYVVFDQIIVIGDAFREVFRDARMYGLNGVDSPDQLLLLLFDSGNTMIMKSQTLTLILTTEI